MWTVGYIVIADHAINFIDDITTSTATFRVIGNLPPVYPNGWFHVIDSWELKPNQVKNIFVLGWSFGDILWNLE